MTTFTTLLAAILLSLVLVVSIAITGDVQCATDTECAVFGGNGDPQ